MPQRQCGIIDKYQFVATVLRFYLITEKIMTILSLAYNGFKALNKYLFSPSPYHSVEHLSDELLKDIGIYRDGGVIYPINKAPLLETVKEGKQAGNEVVFIPKELLDTGG